MKIKKSLSLIIILAICFTCTSCRAKVKFVNNADSFDPSKVEIEWDSNYSYSESDSIDPEYDGEAFSVKSDEPKRIICWGDSLTEGTGGEGVTMPNTLAELSGRTVMNYGVYAETASCIAARQGGNPQYLVEDITIPADCTPIKAQCSGKYGYEMLLVFGNAGINNVTLGGIEGTYEMNDDGDRCFTRLSPGEETFVPSGTQLFTHAMLDKRDNDILIIWVGGNDEPNSEEEFQAIFTKTDEIIAYQGCTEYVIVSDMNPHSRIPLLDTLNEEAKERYGEHFLDLRSYMVNEALDQLGITPTEADLEKIEKGDVPVSLRMPSDDPEEPHGNSDYYRIAGEQVYKKLLELGYLND